MSDISDLNMYEDYRKEIRGTEIEPGRPQWYKFWVEKYATALDIENIDRDLDPEEKETLFYEVGKVFINSMFYFMTHDEGHWIEYKPRTRDSRILWNALKRDIDASYRDYDERVRNGKKGGRPRKE